jgi:4-carboxymuconolactone decarboxylase
MAEVGAGEWEVLIDLTAAVCLGDHEALGAIRSGRQPNRRWREALLQVHLFAGFPAVVEAFARLERLGGLGDWEPDEAIVEPDRPERGAELFARIYGEHAPRVRGFLDGAHPQLGAWVLGHAYGRVLTRPGLSARERELLAVAALALRGPARQLASHLRGAVACGASPAEVAAVFARLEAFAPGSVRADAAELAAAFARTGG